MYVKVCPQTPGWYIATITKYSNSGNYSHIVCEYKRNAALWDIALVKT